MTNYERAKDVVSRKPRGKYPFWMMDAITAVINETLSDVADHLDNVYGAESMQGISTEIRNFGKS